MTTVYKIYTEDKNRDRVINIVSQKFDGFTLYECSGFWQGNPEKSIVIEIITGCKEIEEISKVRWIAEKIKEVNEQQTVYVTKANVDLIAM